jgi:5-methylcytosine-specific restriction endonuclease McrA
METWSANRLADKTKSSSPVGGLFFGKDSMSSKTKQPLYMNFMGSILLSRNEAMELGYKKYLTGRPCKEGHITKRYTSNKQCVRCNAVKAKRREARRCAEDVSYRMFRNVQRRSGQILIGRYSAREALGCDQETLCNHIEAQFTEGMGWHNYGQWEVDHIVPLSASQSLEEAIFLCHFSNTQPLWKRENLRKGNSKHTE